MFVACALLLKGALRPRGMQKRENVLTFLLPLGLSAPSMLRVPSSLHKYVRAGLDLDVSPFPP